ncbi:T3SS effector HopA1 family protein [Microbispora sp. NBRC 16548]|uniref:T3SS effector HopA1 family protein n=1 Tax=Microbispora sp. NBRC 16548 TaxID=3030994 RepID=UPI0024A1ED25|nr:T3SS effector HopA1 family protein [Microbispora sp. NBRC 16548]GLX05641.1 hypothetical protein Misp03_25680 [Microbispora sp. NBRC 16548]
MSTVALRVPLPLLRALDDVHVAPDGLRATVGDRELEAGSDDSLRHKLCAALYDSVHAGRPARDGHPPRTLREPDFEERLAAATPHRTTTVLGRLVSPPEGDAFVALVDGLRVRMPAEQHSAPSPDGRLPLRVPALRPALSPGFFLVDGSEGGIVEGPVLRVYVHITEPSAAPDVWRATLERLESSGLPYRAKISSSARLFPRRDALVVYLGPRTWHLAGDVQAAVRGLAGVGEETSAFVHRLAPGVGLAWDPQDRRPGMSRLSFGEHRATAVAEALLAHARGGAEAPLEIALAEAFTEAGIDPARPARDLVSPRLPQFDL